MLCPFGASSNKCCVPSGPSSTQNKESKFRLQLPTRTNAVSLRGQCCVPSGPPGSLGSLPLTESGTYPISAPGNTGSLSVIELEFISQIVSVTSNLNHIVSLSWLNPPPQNRKIYHFANFPDSFVWTFPPFP